MIKKRLIPFTFLPASWGLSGQSLEEAKANYYLDGEDLERRLIDIREDNNLYKARKHLALDLKYNKIDKYTYDLAMLKLIGMDTDKASLLEIDLRHGKIDNYDHDRRRAEIDFAVGEDLDTAYAEIDLAYEKISQQVYDKTVATIKKEPWVGIVNEGFDPKMGINGWSCEFDWNDYWIDFLKLNGYVGLTEEDIHQAWFQDICRAVSLEQQEEGYDGAEIVPFSGRLATHLSK